MPTNKLAQLHAEIDARVQAIRDDHPDWLCGLGCDGCCHRLAEIPLLTEAEWDNLKLGLNALPPELLNQIGRDIAALADQTTRPIVCPILDRTTGACLVYEHRPVACRTYGFYVQRDKGLYCNSIEQRVAEGDWAEAVWGNHDAVDRRLDALGEKRDLSLWFARWQQGQGCWQDDISSDKY